MFERALVITLVTQYAFCASLFPNVGYLGAGYDMVKGNPQPTIGSAVSDPGFRAKIVNFTYLNGKTTSDQRYAIPDNTESYLMKKKKCSFAASSVITKGQNSYSQHLKQSIDSSPSESIFDDVSFSSSTSYQSFSSSVYGLGHLYVTSHAECDVYHLQLIPNIYSLDTDFIENVSHLPINIDTSNPLDPYYKFIAVYGTNYATKLYFGSKYSRTFEFEQEAWSSMMFQKWDIKTIANVEFAVITGTASNYSEKQIEEAKQFESISLNLYETILGNYPPINGDIDRWINQSTNDPFPYYYELSSISDLFETKFIPNINEADLITKKNNMNLALKNYCNVTPLCDNHKADIFASFIQEYNTTTSDGTGISFVKCPNGYYAISCGISNNQYEQFWQIYPSDSFTCTGYNNYSAVIYAVCAPMNVIDGYKIVKSEKTNGQITVKCDTDYLLTGCGVQFWGTEPYKMVYPLNNTSCLCYDYFGVTCYAICIKGAYKVRIYEKSGTGLRTVKCEQEPLVFGCGLKEEPQSGNEMYPKFYVNNYNSCAGYSSYESNVYAICGTLGN